MQDEFLSQTQIGQIYGVTSHVVGKWLKELGLRNPSTGKPTSTAFELGFVSERPSRQPGTYFYVWHKQKVIELLERRNK